MKFSRLEFSSILLVIFLMLGVQLARIQRPYLGHYASYQGSVMASIARNMLRENFSEIFLPKTDVIVAGRRSLHLNQYPFPSLIAAAAVKLFGGTLEFWGRFQAVIFNLLTALLLILVNVKLFNRSIGLLSGLIYSLSPYTLIYGQSFMSESSSLFFLLLAVYLLFKDSLPRAALSGIAFSIALTGRIHFFLFYPAFLFLLFSFQAKNRIPKLFLFSIFSFLLPAAWYFYTYRTSLRFENVHTNIFVQLFSKEEAAAHPLGTEYLLKVFNLFAQRMLTLLFFPFLFFAAAGEGISRKGFNFILLAIACGGLLIILAPAKVADHDFYLYGVFPFLATPASIGIWHFFRRSTRFRKPAFVFVLILFYFLISSRYFLHPIFKQPADAGRLMIFAGEVRQKTEPERPVIYFGKDPGGVFYYLDRPAWVMEPESIGKPLRAYQKNLSFKKGNTQEIQEIEAARKDPVGWLDYLKRQGAQYLVASDKRELERLPVLMANFKSPSQLISNPEDDFYIFKLLAWKKQ